MSEEKVRVESSERTKSPHTPQPTLPHNRVTWDFKFDVVDEADAVIVAVEANAAEEADYAGSGKASVADEAHVTDEAVEAEAVNEADDTKVDEANEADEAEAKEAIVADEAVVVNKANNASVAEADEANEANKAGEADKANKAGNKLGELLMAVVVLILVFSLTKYSVIFTEVEGDFAKDINNQLK